MDITNRVFDIVDGPNREAIFDAMLYTYEAKIPIDFNIVLGYTAPPSDPTAAAHMLGMKNFQIHSIQHEDGSGYSFNLEGYADVRNGSGYTPCKFKAYYHARSRKGHIKFKKF